jgi:hypothetical protein
MTRRIFLESKYSSLGCILNILCAAEARKEMDIIKFKKIALIYRSIQILFRAEIRPV